MKQEKNASRRYVALGDLVADCYYEEGKLLKVDGGASRFNVICNLAARGTQTRVISACGNDHLGEIALCSLKSQNVDTKFVKRIGEQTKSYHLIVEGKRHTSIKNCPICGKYTWFDTPLASASYCLSHLEPNDIIILDGLKDENIPILKNAEQAKVLDVGRIKRLIPLTNEEILSLLKSANIKIIQLNETVANYMMARFHLENTSQIYSLLEVPLLVITKGKDGAEFISKNLQIMKSLNHYQKELDDTGAGDAFFSVIIQNYFDHNQKVDKQWVDQTFYFANELTCKVVSCLGARGHLWKGYWPNVYNCICSKK